MVLRVFSSVCDIDRGNHRFPIAPRTCIYIYLFACVCVFVCACVCIIYAGTYTSIHIHTYIQGVGPKDGEGRRILGFVQNISSLLPSLTNARGLCNGGMRYVLNLLNRLLYYTLNKRRSRVIISPDVM